MCVLGTTGPPQASRASASKQNLWFADVWTNLWLILDSLLVHFGMISRSFYHRFSSTDSSVFFDTFVMDVDRMFDVTLDHFPFRTLIVQHLVVDENYDRFACVCTSNKHDFHECPNLFHSICCIDLEAYWHRCWLYIGNVLESSSVLVCDQAFLLLVWWCVWRICNAELTPNRLGKVLRCPHS